MEQANDRQLQRQLGTFGAVMMGLGAMIGTGVFVSIGIAAGVAGPAVVLAVAVAAGVATCNGLSSAQLAASHPVSGGTYEYGYKYLKPWMGFIAGWMFLIAKSASAATAALGFAGYALHALELSGEHLVPVALGAVALFTLIVLGGIGRSNLANVAIVSITLLVLLFFVAAGLSVVEGRHFRPFFGEGANGQTAVGALFQASALMFVAYTGYGRIATLGEEVRRPERTIPTAIIATMLVTMILYIGVAIVGVGAVGANGLQAATAGEAAPLAVAARSFPFPFGAGLLAVGAITAMLGVLLNLVLGLSRVLLAMGRRRDMPAVFGRLDRSGATPRWAVLAVGAAIGGLVLVGDVRTTWSFSAFTVLIYYALTNLAAWKLPEGQRRYPRWVAGLGLVACLFLAFWVERETWVAGLGLVFVGLVWHGVARRWASDVRSTE